MSPDRWRAVEQLFVEAAGLPADQRHSLLSERCGGDEELRLEVESLLAHDQPSTGTFGGAVSRMATAALAEGRLEGQRAGAYELIRCLGEGGMGSVYLAVRADDQYRKQAAVKFVRRGMETESAVGRFRRERQILATLEHPHIARLLDGGMIRLPGAEGDVPYLVMEYVEGVPIHEYCRDQGLRLRDRLLLFREVCGAVAYAHQKLVIHRDLKPANILVSAGGTPKLLDFGIGKLLDDASELAETGATIAGASYLTPDYASPEQVSGDRMTTSTDIYSLGAILYELLSGARPHPFRERSLAEIRRVVCLQDVPPLSSAAKPEDRQALRGDLEAIVGQALRKEPGARYASVEQFAADLDRYLEGRPVLARQGKFSYKAGKFLRRYRIPVIAGFLVFASLVGGATIAAWQAFRAEREHQAAELERIRAEQNRVRAEENGNRAVAMAEEAERQQQAAEAGRRAAIVQRAIAEKRFDQVRSLAQRFLFDFHDAIENLPGSTPARQMVVKTALAYYDSLSSDSRAGDGLLRELSTAYERVGDVQGNPYYSNLGDVKGALSSYLKAAALRTRIHETAPAFLRERMLGAAKIGDMRVLLGDLTGAEQAFEQGLSLAPAAADAAPVLEAVLRLQMRMGDLRERTGPVQAALEADRRAQAIGEKLIAREPENVEFLGDLSAASRKVGSILGRMGDIPGALAENGRALAIDQALLERDPNNTGLQRSVMISHITTADLLRSGGSSEPKLDQAQDHLLKALAIAGRTVAADPRNSQAETDLCLVEMRLGGIAKDEGRGDEAIGWFEKALAHSDDLVAKAPESRQFQYIAASNYLRMGATLRDLGRLAAAGEPARRASALFDSLVRSDPKDGRAVRGQFYAERDLAELDRQLGRFDEALATAERAAGRVRQILAHDPADDFFRRQLPALDGLIGMIHEELARQGENTAGHRQQACEAWGRVRLAIEATQAKRPLNAGEQASLQEAVQHRAGVCGPESR